jgi:hypothetical protein
VEELDEGQIGTPQADSMGFDFADGNELVFSLSGGIVGNMVLSGRAKPSNKKLDENFGRNLSSFIIRYRLIC